MQPGDYVLVPNPSKNDVYLGVVVGDYKFCFREEDNDETYPNKRNVRWLGRFLRKDFSQDLR